MISTSNVRLLLLLFILYDDLALFIYGSILKKKKIKSISKYRIKIFRY